MDFDIVILSNKTSNYPEISWSDWKDVNRKQMKSQGDHWSMSTLRGSNIWDCLKQHKIDRLHLVQWKPSGDTIFRVSLPLDH